MAGKYLATSDVFFRSPKVKYILLLVFLSLAVKSALSFLWSSILIGVFVLKLYRVPWLSAEMAEDCRQDVLSLKCITFRLKQVRANLYILKLYGVLPLRQMK